MQLGVGTDVWCTCCKDRLRQGMCVRQSAGHKATVARLGKAQQAVLIRLPVIAGHWQRTAQKETHCDCALTSV